MSCGDGPKLLADWRLPLVQCAQIVAEACRPPKDVGFPVVRWSEALLGKYLRGQGFDISDRTVARILNDALLQPHRQKM
jgi:hypothetical protein